MRIGTGVQRSAFPPAEQGGLLSPRPRQPTLCPTCLMAAALMCEVMPRGGLHPGGRSRKGRSHSRAGATVSTGCGSGRTVRGRDSASPCAPPPPQPPWRPLCGTGAQSRGTGAVPQKGPWRGQRAEGGCAGSHPPQSRGTGLGCSRPLLPWGGTSAS